jgi:hypothetical protein
MMGDNLKSHNKSVMRRVIGAALIMAVGFATGILTIRLSLSQHRKEPVSFVEAPEGIVPAKEEHGLPKEDLEFLRSFRGRLIPALPREVKTTRTALHDALRSDYKSRERILRERYPKLSVQQRFVLYLVLRVNGSLPTYAVRSFLPRTLDRLLLSHRGNCSDHAVRLAMVLDAFGIKTGIIPVMTPSLPGHMLVDAFDPREGTAYLLDSTNNVYIKRVGARGGFFDALFKDEPGQRAVHFREPNALYLPVYFRFVDPGPNGIDATSITVDFLNSQIPKQRQAKWTASFTHEIKHVTDWWRTSYPMQPPRTLKELAEAFGITGIKDFGPEFGIDTLPLWKAAGIPRYDPMAPVSVPAVDSID